MSKTINQELDLRNYEVIEEQISGGYVYSMKLVEQSNLTKEQIEWNMNKDEAVDNNELISEELTNN
tara:strand:+ start:1623 stop:1820 length:198 start_codon:yes stop_codon:yes gene_type:complete